MPWRCFGMAISSALATRILLVLVLGRSASLFPTDVFQQFLLQKAAFYCCVLGVVVLSCHFPAPRRSYRSCAMHVDIYCPGVVLGLSCPRLARCLCCILMMFASPCLRGSCIFVMRKRVWNGCISKHSRRLKQADCAGITRKLTTDQP